MDAEKIGKAINNLVANTDTELKNFRVEKFGNEITIEIVVEEPPQDATVG
jgi:hypothetical protein